MTVEVEHWTVTLFTQKLILWSTPSGLRITVFSFADLVALARHGLVHLITLARICGVKSGSDVAHTTWDTLPLWDFRMWGPGEIYGAREKFACGTAAGLGNIDSAAPGQHQSLWAF